MYDFNYQSSKWLGRKKKYSKQKKFSSLRGRKKFSTRLSPVNANIPKNICIISILSLIYIHINKTGCKVHNCHVVWVGNHLTSWNWKHTWYISISTDDEFSVLVTYCHYHGDFTYIMTCFKRTKSSCKAILTHLRTKACYRKTPHFFLHTKQTQEPWFPPRLQKQKKKTAHIALQLLSKLTAVTQWQNSKGNWRNSCMNYY